MELSAEERALVVPVGVLLDADVDAVAVAEPRPRKEGCGGMSCALSSNMGVRGVPGVE